MRDFRYVKQVMEGFLADGPRGCSCSIHLNNEKVFEECVGYADFEKKKPITPKTIFRIFSMTKSVTSVAALMLYDRGLLRIDEPLYKYLPFFKNMRICHVADNGIISTMPAANYILVRDLMKMTSGIAYPEFNCVAGTRMQRLEKEALKTKKDLTVMDLAELIAKGPLSFEPGTHWLYGYSCEVLAALVERVSGETFSEFLKKELFGPLEMNDTSFKISEGKRDRLCVMYGQYQDSPYKINTSRDNQYEPGYKHEAGGDGLLSTLGDIDRFAGMLCNGGIYDSVRILKDETIREMSNGHLSPAQHKDCDQEGWGYGVSVNPNPPGEFGWGGMAGTFYIVDQRHKMTISYMQNLSPNLYEGRKKLLRDAVYKCL